MLFDGIFGIVLTCVIVVIIFSLLVFLIKRYKKCPSDKVMVIYGKVGSNKDGTTKSAKCIPGSDPAVHFGRPGKRPVPPEHPHQCPQPLYRRHLH